VVKKLTRFACTTTEVGITDSIVVLRDVTRARSAAFYLRSRDCAVRVRLSRTESSGQEGDTRTGGGSCAHGVHSSSDAGGLGEACPPR